MIERELQLAIDNGLVQVDEGYETEIDINLCCFDVIGRQSKDSEIKYRMSGDKWEREHGWDCRCLQRSFKVYDMRDFCERDVRITMCKNLFNEWYNQEFKGDSKDATDIVLLKILKAVGYAMFDGEFVRYNPKLFDYQVEPRRIEYNFNGEPCRAYVYIPFRDGVQLKVKARDIIQKYIDRDYEEKSKAVIEYFVTEAFDSILQAVSKDFDRGLVHKNKLDILFYTVRYFNKVCMNKRRKYSYTNVSGAKIGNPKWEEFEGVFSNKVIDFIADVFKMLSKKDDINYIKRKKLLNFLDTNLYKLK